MNDAADKSAKLRALLDERGVEYHDEQNFVKWNDANQHQCFAFETYGRPGLLRVHCNLTPEQAVAATLGNCTLTAEQVRETVEKHWHDLPDEYDMPEATALQEYSYDWQAIADELNAALGRAVEP